MLAIATVIGCFGGKRGPRGSNTTVGNGSDYDGPWSGGTTPAHVATP